MKCDINAPHDAALLDPVIRILLLPRWVGILPNAKLFVLPGWAKARGGGHIFHQFRVGYSF